MNGLRRSLAGVGARYYKLTPPLDESFALQGHGFHFTLGTEPTFLDVMGNPPRVGGFARAAARSVRMETEWGILPVISIPDLVELKLTQRLEDYAVVSRLAIEAVRNWATWNEESEPDGPDSAETTRPCPVEFLDWAIDRVFTLDTLTELLTEPRADWNRYHGRHAEEVHTWRVQAASSEGWGSDDADRVTGWMQRRMATLQSEDRTYWRPIINRLKQLRLDQVLMPVGGPV